MNGKSFVDTNILIYAHDVDAGSKHEKAKRFLLELWSERTGVLSMQVLQEFYVNVTRKIAAPLTRTSARNLVYSYATWCIETTPAEISAASHLEGGSLSFWDALIVACAVKSGTTRLLSEDMNSGQRIEGVLIENPFLSTPNPR